MYLKITNGEIELNNKVILSNIDFTIKGNEKIGLVGKNGSGKTTLLKAITNEIEFTSSNNKEKLSITKSNYSIGYLHQETYTASITMIDYIRSAYKDILSIEEKLSIYLEELSTKYNESTLVSYNNLLKEYTLIGGYSYKKEYEQALKKFGFTEKDKEKPLSSFSGGEITKLSLLKLILSKSDLLILDEPTNHLDIKALTWLEDYLKNYKGNIILVSHDRMFLDNICNVIYSIESSTLKRYKGNYTAYIKQREENYNKELKEYNLQTKEINRLMTTVDKFKYKPTKAKMAMSKLKQIDRINKIDKPTKLDHTSFKVKLNNIDTSYKEVIKLKNLSIGYTKELFNINLNIIKNDKIAIIGENGIGKSTFVKTIMGIIPPLSGKIVVDPNSTISYFSQLLDNLDINKTIYDEISTTFPTLSPLEVRTLLALFNFKNDDVFKYIKDLSGGEKVRVSLCIVFNKPSSILILDEPTNHLDIDSKETIQTILNNYTGTLLIISHDRYLLKNTCNKFIYLTKTKVIISNNYIDNYLEEDIEIKEKIKKEKVKDNTIIKVKELEKEIKSLENKVNNLNQELLKEEVYMSYTKSNEINLQIESITLLINKKEEEWLNLVDTIK